jgi:hypothetical protein
MTGRATGSTRHKAAKEGAGTVTCVTPFSGTGVYHRYVSEISSAPFNNSKSTGAASVLPEGVDQTWPTLNRVRPQVRERSLLSRTWFGRSTNSGRGGERAKSTKVRKVMAVASGGGHWVQLQRLRPALALNDVVFVTTDPGYAEEVAPYRAHFVNDAARDSKVALVLLALRMAIVLIRERPDVVISTGAAPGYFALRLGRLFGARTIWIDSIANVDEVSLAGRLAKRYADLWLTQWPHLASGDGPQFSGAVL